MKILSKNDRMITITVDPYQSVSFLHDLTNYTQEIYEVNIYLQKESSLEYTAVITGDTHIQKKIQVYLQGAQAQARINGVYSMSGQGKLELITVQHHQAEDASSVLSYNGIAHDAAHAHYSGMIRIDHTAPRTQAAQENKTLLLSEQARAWSVPGIEVLHNDVQCAHGSAISYLDQEQLVYLLSRGIPEIRARRLLVEGFCKKQLAFILSEEMKLGMMRELLNSLDQGER